MHPLHCQCVKCLVDRSSFGTPEAKAARESVSDEQVARVMARVKELDAEQTPDIERVLATAESDLRLAVDELCPHGPEEHAEGTCETCDTAFAVDSEIQEAFQTLAQALAPVLAAAVREAEQRALRRLSEDEAEAIDRWMDDHMYGHQISNSYAGMSCNSQCRTQALGMAVARVLADRVAEPQHEAATSGKESEASDE